MIKFRTVVDDAINESVVLEAEHAISGAHLMRILDRVCSERGAPKVIRTDNGPEFTGAAMLSWAYRRGIELRLIEPGKPN